MMGKILRTEKNLSKARRWQPNLVCSKHKLGIYGESLPQNTLHFSLYLGLKTAFPEIK